MRSADEHAVATAIISLMREVVYRDVPAQEGVWEALARHRGAIADHFAEIGVDVVVDEAEGYAYLRTREPDDGEEALPRLVRRRSLTYNVSLLLVLLRRRMVEFEASGEAGKLVLTRDQIVELLRVFQASSTNEARIVEQADRTIAQVADLGFLRELRGQRGAWEVRRILKAYVDAQTLADFSARLAAYAGGDASRGDAGAAADGGAAASVGESALATASAVPEGER